VNGVPSVGITVQRSSDANAVAVSESVLVTLENAKTRYQAQQLDFVIAANSSEFTMEASRSVMKDLFIAIVLVALTMLLFLHSLRNALIVTVAIPMSLVSMFTFMYLSGFSLNLMSLLGLTLVVSILVDDAIVVVENIHSHLEMGKTGAGGIRRGSRNRRYHPVNYAGTDGCLCACVADAGRCVGFVPAVCLDHCHCHAVQPAGFVFHCAAALVAFRTVGAFESQKFYRQGCTCL
jgi:Cu/Ag efflux pump CusA